MPKKLFSVAACFLMGMFYAGQMSSRVESYAIAKYLRSHGLVDGTLKEVEMQVIEAMTVLHHEKAETDA